ncbi:hypothetical protein Dimus_033124 [Dionaea muscipula]
MYSALRILSSLISSAPKQSSKIYTAMEEEFQESDIVFSDVALAGANDDEPGIISRSTGLISCPKLVIMAAAAGSYCMSKNKKKREWTVPVEIPKNFVFRENSDHELDDDDDEEGRDNRHDQLDAEEMVPPHVIISRRSDTKIARSFYDNGMSLKGRNLRRVRNSVLRMTGFIEC